jgi:hypothetical protein
MRGNRDSKPRFTNSQMMANKKRAEDDRYEEKYLDKRVKLLRINLMI